MAHEKTACDGCGQVDDHPKNHFWGRVELETDDPKRTVSVTDPTLHFDCFPPSIADIYKDAPQHARSQALREAALSGIHGDDLRAHGESLPDDNGVEQVTA